MAYKLFSTGEVLTAANVNSLLMRQTVMVFTDSAARATALSGVLTQGMISYLTGTNSLEVYDGSTWSANGTGDVTLNGVQTLTNKTLTAPVIDNPRIGYSTTATAAGTTTLTATSNFQQYFTGTSTQTVVLPVVSTLVLGASYYINNNSTGIVTVQSSGANTILALPGNTTAIFTVISTTGTTAASWDADYTGATSITGTGSLVLSSGATLKSPREITTVSATAATGTINFDANTQAVLYYTTNASANWTLNVRGDGSTTLNTLMATGDTLTITHLVTQGSTAYYNNAFTIDGTSVTPKWQNGTAPAAGNASSIDAYTYAIVKTGSAAYTVFASQTKFA
jgi:hypothetical protein